VREYRYRKHIRWGQYVLPVVFAFGAIAPWLVVLAFGLRPDASGAQVVYVLAVVVTVVSVVIGAPVWWMYWRLAGIAIRVQPDAFVYRNRSGEKRLAYDRIGPLHFPGAPYLGGWVALRAGDETVRLTVVVEGIGELLRELKAALDARGLSASYQRGRLYAFMKTAEYADQSWERIYEVFWKLVLATLGGVLAGVLFALLVHARGGAMLLWILISALWPVLVYSAAEVVFGRRVAKRSDEASFSCPPRDPQWERAVYRKAILWGAGLYLLACVGAWAAWSR
jgi:hypothetical protein